MQTKRNIKYTALWIYAILTTIAFGYMAFIHHQSLNDKNFDYLWNAAGTVLKSIDKKTGEVVNEFVDDNYDLCFERQIQYAMKGRVKVEFMDRDENGYYESMEYLVDNEKRKIWLDRNADFYYESGLIILESSDTLRFEDSNENGWLELLEE